MNLPFSHPSAPRARRVVALSLLVVFPFACKRDAPSGEADAAVSLSAPPPGYARFGVEARKADLSSLPSGDVALAKGRKIAPVDRRVSVIWALDEQRQIDKGGEIASLMGALVSPKSPYCPGNKFSLCNGKAWFASEPEEAGVVVYLERRIAPSGKYFARGSETALANAYEGVWEFDAVIMPEKIRVARWWRKVYSPSSVTSYGKLGIGFQVPRHDEASFEGDMSQLFGGQAPESDFRSAPWDDPPSERDAGVAQSAKSSAPRGRGPRGM